MLLLVTAALGWSHRGHLWEDDAFPLKVCAEPSLLDSADEAIGQWHRATRRQWFTLDCDEPDIEVGFDRADAGPLVLFQLLPEKTALDACEYESIARGRVDVSFSGVIDWSQPVGTGVGQCDGDALQTRLLMRYFGVVLGLDSSAAGDAMAAFDSCDISSVGWDETAGLEALYGQGSCSASTSPTPAGTEPSGCQTASAMGVFSMLAIPLFRRRRPQPD